MPLPGFEDCRTQMQKNLPQAHQLAIRKVTQAISYYEQVASIVRNTSSMAEIESSLGRVCSSRLSVYWDIDVRPNSRESKHLLGELSTSEIRSEILKPLEHILSVYRDIKAGLLKGDFNYECEYRDRWWYQGCEKGDSGWVGRYFPGDIHICVDEIDPTDIEKLSGTIIHEASHRFGNTTHDSKRIHNADYYDTLDAIPAYGEWGWVNAARQVDTDGDGRPDQTSPFKVS
jgi:hypothetical protein